MNVFEFDDMLSATTLIDTDMFITRTEDELEGKQSALATYIDSKDICIPEETQQIIHEISDLEEQTELSSSEMQYIHYLTLSVQGTITEKIESANDILQKLSDMNLWILSRYVECDSYMESSVVNTQMNDYKLHLKQLHLEYQIAREKFISLQQSLEECLF